MQFLIPVTLIGWLPVCLVLFMAVPRLQAVVIGVVGAWLFLPPSGISISGLPDYVKGSAFGYGILLGTFVFQPDRLLHFRPHWLDLPMLGLCLCSFASSIMNGLGPYDGLSTVVSTTVTWGLPYLVGRLHFGDRQSLRYLLVGVVVGSLVYVPFCFFEMRMSPVLLSKVYGSARFKAPGSAGIGRAFFASGLELGMWMTVASLTAVWLRKSGELTRLAGYPFGPFFLPLLIGTTILCRSSGAILLLMVGLMVLWASNRYNSRLPMVLLLAVPLLYVAVRIPNLWDYNGLITFLERNFDPARGAESLQFRFRMEDVLIAKAIEQPYFGWGGWGRVRVISEQFGKDITVTDGLWIIQMGAAGLVGLGLWLSVFMAPAFVFVHRNQPRRWADPAIGLQAVVVCILGMYWVDCLLNAMMNSVYTVMLGGLVSSLQLGRGFGGGEASEGRAFDDAEGDEGRRRFGGSPGGDAASASLPEVRLADRYIELARGSKQSGAYEAAALAWRHALGLLVHQNELAPDDPHLARRRFDCANNLAWFLLCRPDPGPGDHAEAVELARRATQADPSIPAYWNTLAAALCRIGDHAGTIAAVQTALALEDAGTGFDFALLAIAHARLGEKVQGAAWLVQSRIWCEENRSNHPELDALLAEADAALRS